MELLSIEDLGRGGLNTDLRPWTLPANMFTSGMNFRVLNGSVRSSGGSRSLATPSTENYPGYVLNVNSPLGVYWMTLGRSEVLVYDGSNWDTISSWLTGTSPLNEGDELLWTGCVIGKVPFTNNPQHYPEYWAPQSSGQDLQALPFSVGDDWSTIGISAKVLRSHKNVLFALNLTESLNAGPIENYPDAYRWSHPADTNGIPFSWDPTEVSSLAGRAQVGSDAGALVDGLSLRNSFILYSQNSIDVLDPDPEFVWRRRKLSSTHGLFNRNALVEVKGAHYFLSDGDIVMTDGNSIKSIMHERLRVRLTANANAGYYSRAFAVRNDNLKEVWFCVPEGDSEWPNIAYIFNWVDNSWAIRELPSQLVHASFGPTIISTQVLAHGQTNSILATTSQLNWNDWGGTWAEQTRTWNSGSPIPPDPEPPSGDFVWFISSSGTRYGYTTNYGGLDPNKVENVDITELTVDSADDNVYFETNGQVSGSPTITITLETNESVTVTWDDINDIYVGSDSAFVAKVVAESGTSIGVNMTVDDAATPPPITPLTASGDTLVGVRFGNGNLEILDPTTKDAPVSTLIERTDLPIGGHREVTSFVRVYPHVTGTQEVTFTFGTQQHPGDAVNWKKPITFNPETQRKIDIRATGPLHAWRIESNNTGNWAFSGFDIEYAYNGKR